MDYRAFGRTGWRVSEIGYGTWGIGSMWGPLDEAEASRAIERAVELGVNFFDTAAIYGQGLSETVLGRALGRVTSTVYVATKVYPKNMEWPARHALPVDEAFPAEWIVRCTEESLRRMARPAIDLQQLHVWSPRWLAQADRWLPAVEQLKRRGLIRAFGISINDHEPDTALEAVASGLIDSVQVIYNLFEQRPATALLPACQRHGVGVIARVPFDEGSLTGTFTLATTFHPEDWRASYFRGARLADTVARVERLRPVLASTGLTLPQAALAFCLSHPAVGTVIPGMRRVRHVDDNAAAAGARLPAELLERLRAHAWPRNFYRDDPRRDDVAEAVAPGA
jgi:aryl-alcohol dehydrogenase-like predicted oxidoreductase